MRLLAFLLLIGSLAQAAVIVKPQAMVSGIITASSTNVTASYGSAGTLLTGLVGKQHVAVINEASTDIAVSISGSSCSGNTTDFYVLGSNGGVVLDNVLVSTKVCVKSTSGTISTGSIYGWAW